jgi:(p)ppGpp synthase/HD superfamily hydrolase
MLTDRFNDALIYAAIAHRAQRRKGSDTPYVAHLLSVCSLVLEHGGDEDQAIAALLHDVVEEQGGKPRLAEVRAQFGERVAAIVQACSDTDVMPKPPWKARKLAYIEALRHHGLDSWLVSCADKVHNADSILRDHRILGEAIWDRFTGGKDGTLWYYRTLADEFLRLMPGPLAQHLDDVVSRLEIEAGKDGF